MEDPLYLREPFTKWQAWCDLILLAYFAPADFFVRGIKVKAKRGCVYKAALELADRWRWSRGKVERFLAFLVTDKRIEIKKSKVVSCITILNYDRYQQTDPSDGKAAVSGMNEEQTAMLQQLVEQMSELKERLNAQEQKPEKKPSKKKAVNPLITMGREVFEKKYADLFDGGVYYWQAKDAAAMDALTKKIIYSRKERGMSVEDDDVIKALQALLDSIRDTWILKNFSTTNINSKYNEIVAQAKAAVAYGNSNGVNQFTKEARAQDAASIIARLAAQEGSDYNPIR